MTAVTSRLRTLAQDTEARQDMYRHIRFDAYAIRDWCQRVHYRSRSSFFVMFYGLAAVVVAAMFVHFLLAPVVIAVVFAVTHTRRWSVRGMWRRACLEAEVFKLSSWLGRVHTQDWRMKGPTTGAKWQEIPAFHRRITPKLYDISKTAHGWTARVEAPAGHTLEFINKREEKMRSRMGWKLLHAEATTDPGVGFVSVSTVDPFRGLGVEHPALAHATNAWDPCPVGIDENGREVCPELGYEAVMCTGLPNSGKSVTMTNVLLHFALDPAVPLFISDVAEVDMVPFEECVKASGFGRYELGSPDMTIEVMGDVLAEIERRQKVIREGGLASFRRKIERGELPPAVWVLEEWPTVRARCKSKQQRDEFDRRHLRIMLNHRKVAVVPLVTVQDPNYDVVPVTVRNEYGTRFAHRSVDDMASDVALGHGWAEKGYSAASISKNTPGVSLYTGGDTVTRMRAYNVSDQELVRACLFAAKNRLDYRKRSENGKVRHKLTGARK